VTYATLSADDSQLHENFDTGIQRALSWLEQRHPFYIGGEPRFGRGYLPETSPIDRDLLVGEFAQGTGEDARDAVAAAQAFAPEWAATPWQERVHLLRQAADRISERRHELAALVSFEVGKNRLEALGDVEETADLIRYYCHQMEAHDGFDCPMDQLSPNERTRSVLRPYGVWAIISPFNYPMALAGGPAGGALVAGNAVVLKPAHQGVFTCLKLYEALRDGGVPAGAVQLVSGAGSVVGRELVDNTGVDGLTFTGSYAVGMEIYRAFAKDYPKPVICEMGGKNPAIVTESADLDLAAEGVMRSAFGFGGQKCSACSRVYVDRRVASTFTRLLVEKTQGLPIGSPLDRDVYLGPIIDQEAVARYEQSVRDVETAGGTILTGGRRLTDGDLARGNYVEPTVVSAPLGHPVFAEELFIPFVVVAPVDSLDEALRLSNDTAYGLTAGCYSSDQSEIDVFLERIEAGVVYVNRRAGATTGAWPGVQPFGGWKASGTTGKAGGGLHYVQQYMREQSRTLVQSETGGARL